MAVDTDKAEDFLREKSKEVRSTIFDIAKKKAAEKPRRLVRRHGSPPYRSSVG
eukprot:CAMPEP_0178864442 /NCGR_PEP_ID=MMETSP0747-20121128/3890_1 /TAXON_ID=913974 /ORGANISM="Nitzschia punctata, Strain CCMP561" /LENGTH=52 /DNA_ID=CAMNT_0020531185 /DNA_START=353 /DNA_END=511 /DNA_ORIENTATION=-